MIRFASPVLLTILAIVIGWFVIGLGSQILNDLIFRASTLIMLAVSWNLMASAGLISLGQSAFWGLGSYACVLSVNAWSVQFGMSFIPAALIGALAGGVMALCTGRLRGIYFAVATLALSEGLRVVALMLPDLTGGSTGLYLSQEDRPRRDLLYLAAVMGASGSVGLVALLMMTRLRYAIRALRNNEDAAQMIGINPLYYRTIISAMAGALAACAGSLNIWYGAYLTPDIAFTLHYAVQAQIATIIGGVFTQAGPVIGSLLILGLSEVTRTSLTQVSGASQLVYGVLLVLFVLFLPGGLASLVRRQQGAGWRRLRPGVSPT